MNANIPTSTSRNGKWATVLLAFAMSCFAWTASAKDGVPIKGSSVAQDIQVGPGPALGLLEIDGIGSGNSTHLGRITFTYTYELNLSDFSFHGSTHSIAANGDTLDTEFIGYSLPTGDPDVLASVQLHTITGGTGRFNGATGSYTVNGFYHLSTGVLTADSKGTVYKEK
jgi:hypothetical protein